MLNFGASKPRVRGGARAPGAPPLDPRLNLKAKFEGQKCSFHGVLDISILIFSIFTGRNKVVAKVMFLLVSVILLTGGGGCLPQCMLGADTPWEQTPPWKQTPQKQTPPGSRHPPPPGSRHPLGADTPWKQTPSRSRHLPSGADTPPPPPGSRHPVRDTVNERPVRILLECILVPYILWLQNGSSSKIIV